MSKIVKGYGIDPTETFTALGVAHLAREVGGGTFEVLPGKRYASVETDAVTGYFVALQNGIENLPNLMLTGDLLNTFAHVYELRESKLFLGLWRDPNGLWSIDRVTHIENREFALLTAKANKQRAIWDIANNEEVFV